MLPLLGKKQDRETKKIVEVFCQDTEILFIEKLKHVIHELIQDLKSFVAINK